MTAKRVAAIDCGTNSIRLLIADVDAAAGTLVDLDRRMEIVRLGEGVDRTGRLAEAALERTFAACAGYAAAIEAAGVEAVRFVATSASRDAENREDFVSGVLERIGVAPEVVTRHRGGRAVLRRRDPRGPGLGAGSVPRPRHRRRLDRVRARDDRADGRPVGGHGLRTADRALPAVRPAYPRRGRGGSGRGRAARRRGRGGGALRRSPYGDRPRGVRHDGRRDPPRARRRTTRPPSTSRA